LIAGLQRCVCMDWKQQG